METSSTSSSIETSVETKDSFDLLMDSPLGERIHKIMGNLGFLSLCTPQLCDGIVPTMYLQEADQLLYTNLAALLYANSQESFSGTEEENVTTHYYSCAKLPSDRNFTIIHAGKYIMLLSEIQDSRYHSQPHFVVLAKREGTSGLELLVDDENQVLNRELASFFEDGMATDAICRKLGVWGKDHNIAVTAHRFRAI